MSSSEVRDTAALIIRNYFSHITTRAYEFEGVRYPVRPLTVSPLVLRGFTCPPVCGACCLKVTLDYLPHEQRPPGTERRTVYFNGTPFLLHSDMQRGNETNNCHHLRKSDGRCSVYGYRPMLCDFAITRFFRSGAEQKRLSTQLPGRNWSLMRVDGLRGTRCEMTPADEESVRDAVRKLWRLDAWAEHFGLGVTRIPRIVEWAESAPTTALHFGATE